MTSSKRGVELERYGSARATAVSLGWHGKIMFIISTFLMSIHRPKMRQSFLLSISMLIVPIAFAQSAGEESMNDPNQPPVLNDTEQCKAARVQLAMPLWPTDALRAGTTGWTVIQYDLDGSGRAQKALVAVAAPRQTFDRSALLSIKRSRFAPGVSARGCKALIVFSKAAP